MSHTRYHMENGTHMVEFPHNWTGLSDMRRFRRTHAAFKRRHIRVVIQCFPSQIVCGCSYELT